MKTAIVGAGAAGLSLAMMLPGPVTIFEETGRPGGLCRSANVRGFTFDQGPHILGGIPEAVDWILENTEGVEWVEGETHNVGWSNGGFVAHPFESDLTGLRYMTKMWKANPLEFSKGGLGAQRGRRIGGVSSFKYPLHGGYQAITNAWAREVAGKIVTRRISPYGLPRDFDRLVWTAPVPKQRYNSLLLVTAGFEGPPPPYTAVYCPDETTAFHRLSFPSNFSPYNAPAGWWSVQGEMSFAGDEISYDGYKADFLGLVAAVTGSPQVPDFFWVQKIPHAYPVPFDTSVDLAESFMFDVTLGSDDMYFHGRTGSHSYLNIDGVVAQSLELASNLAPEHGKIGSPR